MCSASSFFLSFHDIALCCTKDYAAGFVFAVVLPVFCSVPDSLLSLCPPYITEELFQLLSLEIANSSQHSKFVFACLIVRREI